MNGVLQMSRRNAPRPAAFTMIELMVVVAIMGIVLSMGIPNIYHIWKKEPMRQTISDVVELCSNARARSILQGSVSEMVFNGGDGSISVNTGAAVASPSAAPGDSGMVPATPPPSGKSSSMRLPDSVAISKLLVNGLNGMDRNQIRVRFFPNGTCDDLILQLRSDKNDQVEITLELTTGLALVKYNAMEFRLR